ncbi:MAG: carbohydrate-binding protein [Elusimicrobia bacterium]|nr:carbohydrate-binding protein [Elusimicrobiota bacterium]
MQKLVKIVCNFVVCMFIVVMFAGSILSGATDTTPPAKITYFLTAYPTAKSITLVWRSVGDDGYSGTATKYDIRYSLSPITTEAEWNSATMVKCDLVPNPAGSAESFIVFGLSPSKKYYFAIKAGDKVPNWSPLSKSPSATTPALTDTTPPGKIIDLATSGTTSNSITLTWTAPGDNNNSSAFVSRYIPYDIRYSFSPITDANWNSATKVKDTITAQEKSRSEKFNILGLSPSMKYYFAIKTADDVPNWSSVSNSPNGNTKAIGITTPYKGIPFQIPCKIEVEDYDNGGQGVAYYDTTSGDSGNAYRTTEDVDVEPCSDASGGYDIGWVYANEWLKYTVNVKTAGTYTIEVRVGCGGSGGNFHVEFDDVDKTGPITVPNTGGFQIWQTIKKTGVSLTPGKHIMKLVMDTTGSTATGNFDYINILSERQLKQNITSNAISNNNSKISLTPSNDKLFFHEGAVFPNPNLAPINPPYIIYWCGGPGEQPHETMNYSGYKWMTKSWQGEMIEKGKLPIPFTYAARDDASKADNPGYLDTEEKMYNNYFKIASEGYYGVSIDEWVVWEGDNRVKESISALRRVKKQYPNFLMFAGYYGDGFDDVMANASDIMNLYKPEIYIYRGMKDYRTYIKKWTDWIKYYGLEGKNLAILGGRDDYNGREADVDLWIKYLRAESPQMAGLGIGIFKLYSLTTAERAEWDKVMDNNFFKLSPSVSITTPVNNAKLSGTVKINVSAKKNSETDNPVVSYRYFIDNKLVKISSSPEYSWNTAGYSKGKHIITVHAVTDDYLAGVSQINITIKNSQ